MLFCAVGAALSSVRRLSFYPSGSEIKRPQQQRAAPSHPLGAPADPLAPPVGAALAAASVCGGRRCACVVAASVAGSPAAGFDGARRARLCVASAGRAARGRRGGRCPGARFGGCSSGVVCSRPASGRLAVSRSASRAGAFFSGGSVRCCFSLPRRRWLRSWSSLCGSAAKPHSHTKYLSSDLRRSFPLDTGAAMCYSNTRSRYSVCDGTAIVARSISFCQAPLTNARARATLKRQRRVMVTSFSALRPTAPIRGGIASPGACQKIDCAVARSFFYAPTPRPPQGAGAQLWMIVSAQPWQPSRGRRQHSAPLAHFRRPAGVVGGMERTLLIIGL